MKATLKQIKRYVDYLDTLANRNINFGKITGKGKTFNQDDVSKIFSAVNKFKRDFRRTRTNM